MAKGWTVADKKDDDPLAARLAELDRLIEEQKARMAAAPPAGGNFEVLEKILNKQLENQQQLAESQRTIHRQNPQHPGKSDFSYPEGDLKRPKPTFLAGANGQPREVFFNGHRESIHDLKPAEIEAYNKITHSCQARDGRWTAVVTANRLMVTVPSYTIDDRMDLPNGLVLILAELAQGTRAVDPASMQERLLEMERQLAELKGVGSPA